VVHGGGLEAISKTFLVPMGRRPMTNGTCFLIGERLNLMISMLYECTFRKKYNLIISKNGIFGIFTIIDQIHIGDSSLTRGQIKKGN
jgi:hypothetical protein